MKMTKTKLAKGFTLVELLVVIAIIAALAALSTPVVLKQQKKAAATEAVTMPSSSSSSCLNLTRQRSIPTCAQTSYWCSPQPQPQLQESFMQRNCDSMKTSSYAKTAFSIKPDGDIGTASLYVHALAAGECGFGYS